MGYRGNDRFSTDPTGRLAAGAPSGGGGGPRLSVGSVGNAIPSAVFPGRTMGTAPGVSVGFGGGRGGVPMTPKDTAGAVKKRAKGGKIDDEPTGGKKRTKAKKYAAGGSTASKRADGCATKGKTKGRFV